MEKTAELITSQGGHHRRAVASGWQIGFGNIGGIIAVFAFLAKDAPRYRNGYSIGLGFMCLSIVSQCAYFAACLFENRRRERTPKREDGGWEEGELGDLSMNYRYQL